MRGVFSAVVLALLASSALTVALAPAARAQIESREGIALQNQILELRQELQNLQQSQAQAAGQPGNLPAASPEYAPPQPGGAEAPPGSGDIVAQLLVRVTSLEEQVRTLHGRVEELANAQQHDHDDLAKQIGDLAFKLGQGGQPVGQPGGLPPQGQDADQGAPAPGPDAAGMDLSAPAPAPKPPPAVHLTPEATLKQGAAALARRDYPGAEAAARIVLAAGHGQKSPDATYLLARAQAGQHQYKAAAASFYLVYKASPKSARGAEGLIGVANALAGLNDTNDACQAVAKFNAEFPHPDSVLRQSAASARKRAGCR